MIGASLKGMPLGGVVTHVQRLTESGRVREEDFPARSRGGRSSSNEGPTCDLVVFRLPLSFKRENSA